MLVRYGGGITDARGSIGGQTHSRNRSGAYVRARVTPINPQSPRQSAIRAIVASLAIKWNSVVTAAQRAAWGVFASNVPATNKLGEVINLSGFNQFIKSNIAALNASQVFIAEAPVVFTLPGEDPVFAASVDAGTGIISVTFDDTRDWLDEDNGALIVQMGMPQNASIAFFNGPWRHAGQIQGNSTTPPTSPDATIVTPYGSADGQKVFVRAKIIREDGRLSDWFRLETIVATA